jgi:hypothetical protein
MAESETHKRLKLVACAFLKKFCVDAVSTETKFKNIRSIADACGINLKRKEVRVIEVKATWADYKRDSKLFKLEKSYYPHCNYFYIMCPTDVIPKDKVLKEIGLIYVDEYGNIDVVQKPQKNKKLKTKFETTLKNTCRSITNDLIFKFLRVFEKTHFLDSKMRGNKINDDD